MDGKKSRRDERMKVFIEIDTEKNPIENVHSFIDQIYKKHNPGQTTLKNNADVVCDKCGCILKEKYDEDTATKIINFCKIKYKQSGKIYCKDCQTTLEGDNNYGNVKS